MNSLLRKLLSDPANFLHALSFFGDQLSVDFNSCSSHFVMMMKHQEIRKPQTTLSNGYLGSRNDEERSEMRYVMRIAELSESSNL